MGSIPFSSNDSNITTSTNINSFNISINTNKLNQSQTIPKLIIYEINLPNRLVSNNNDVEENHIIDIVSISNDTSGGGYSQNYKNILQLLDIKLKM
jgi:hypothetical protein